MQKQESASGTHVGTVPQPVSGKPDAFKRYLCSDGLLSEDALSRAEQIAKESDERFEAVLTRLGMMPETRLAEALRDYLEIPLTAQTDFPDEAVPGLRLSRDFLRQAQLIPLEAREASVVVAMAYPLNAYAREAVRFATGKTVEVRVALCSDIDAAYHRLYADSEASPDDEPGQDNAADIYGEDLDRLRDIASDAPVIKFVNQMIAAAVDARASDIHIEPMEDNLVIRYRIDGVLHNIDTPSQQMAPAIVSRIKIMAKLNIAERRLPQDGRIVMAVRGKDIDFRVSTTPTIHGESVVLRILDQDQLALDFAALGFDERLVGEIRNLLGLPHGIFLVTGPTGSGKTTTLYTALRELNTTEKKILTIEDPVEYHLDGINQVQVKPQIGLSFVGALRSFLRQDPDIMMVGEIRDLETAQIAVQSALTGHLILSTLHTNDAASAITRLLDMGVEDYLLTSTINGVAAQRLVRTLCPHCREAYTPLPEYVDRLGLRKLRPDGPIRLYRPVGCEACNHTGYRGRSSIVEVLPISDPIRQAILASEDATAINRLAIARGMRSMRDHGLEKAMAGQTSVDEVLRVTRIV